MALNGAMLFLLGMRKRISALRSRASQWCVTKRSLVTRDLRAEGQMDRRLAPTAHWRRRLRRQPRLFESSEQAFDFVERFLVFGGGVGLGGDAAAGREVELAGGLGEGADQDAAVGL